MTKKEIKKLTPNSKQLFIDYAKDADNWNGMPLVGGNVKSSKSDNGNLTDLKKAGLIITFEEGKDIWLKFTDAGIKFASSLGININIY